VESSSLAPPKGKTIFTLKPKALAHLLTESYWQLVVQIPGFFLLLFFVFVTAPSDGFSFLVSFSMSLLVS